MEAISRLAPKDVAVTLEQRNSLGFDPETMRGIMRVVDAIAQCAPPTMTKAEAFDILEQMVRAHFARQIST